MIGTSPGRQPRGAEREHNSAADRNKSWTWVFKSFKKGTPGAGILMAEKIFDEISAEKFSVLKGRWYGTGQHTHTHAHALSQKMKY